MVKIFQGLIKSFFSSFLQAFLNILVGSLSNTILKIVQDVGRNTDWSNEAKRNEAFAKIKLIAINSGNELKDSTINLALELALNILKGNKA